MRETRITAHAIERWQQRVDPDANWLSAHLAIRRFLNQSRWRPTPRHWMHRPAVSGTIYTYSASQPDICIHVTGDAAVTVTTRELVRSTPRRPASASQGKRPLAVPPPIPAYIDELAA
jgi:hypothetical protein